MNLNEEKQALAAKKVKYTASIIYLIVFAFIVGGSYLNQQKEQSITTDTMEETEIIWPKTNNASEL